MLLLLLLLLVLILALGTSISRSSKSSSSDVVVEFTTDDDDDDIFGVLFVDRVLLLQVFVLRSGDNTLQQQYLQSTYAYKNLGWLIGSILLLPGCLLLLLPLSFSRRCRLLGTIGRSSPTPCAWPSSSSLSLVLRILYDVRYGAAFLFDMVAHCVRYENMVWYPLCTLQSLKSHSSHKSQSMTPFG